MGSAIVALPAFNTDCIGPGVTEMNTSGPNASADDQLGKGVGALCASVKIKMQGLCRTALMGPPSAIPWNRRKRRRLASRSSAVNPRVRKPEAAVPNANWMNAPTGCDHRRIRFDTKNIVMANGFVRIGSGGVERFVSSLLKHKVSDRPCLAEIP